jgi:cell division protein FtsI (penicillin-binding protein 3)
MYSSNIGAAQMGEMVGDDALEKFYRDLGLGDPLPLEIREIAHPHFPSPWREINTLTASFGHGVSVSPLQLVAAASAIADGGTLIHPTLILSKAKSLVDDDRRAEVRVISEDTSRKMRELLRLVVTSGTAKQAEVQGYDIGGKTGTADKPSAGGYDHKRKLSSFLGFFPIDKPRYAVYVLVDEPKGTARTHGFATGGWVGAPAVARVISSMAPLLGMPPHHTDAQADLAAPLYQYVHLTGGAGATY